MAGKSSQHLWDTIASELNLPNEVITTDENASSLEGGLTSHVSAKGSKLRRRARSERIIVNSLSDAIDTLVKDKIILVIDDFHYLTPETRTAFLRNVKGAVFAGLKVLLLSVTHRAFDAIKAESELTGRFTSITLPAWTREELKQIPLLGFKALNVHCKDALIEKLALEAQDSPFLMQKFCWEVCFDCDIEHAGTILTARSIPESYDAEAMFIRLAQDAGLPIYQRLVAGPQSRKIRTKRPLRSGGEADIYQALLVALAETGPKTSISYDELRASLNSVLSDKVPQKHEVTAALKHLAVISMKAGTEVAIDWDEDNRKINLIMDFTPQNTPARGAMTMPKAWISGMSGAPGSTADYVFERRKIAEMIGVRAYGNEPEVELWLNERGRLVVVAYNESGHAATEVDLWDILDWVQAGPRQRMVLDNGSQRAAGTRGNPVRS